MNKLEKIDSLFVRLEAVWQFKFILTRKFYKFNILLGTLLIRYSLNTIWQLHYLAKLFNFLGHFLKLNI